jgi:YidC/Oxa1 family membrane protein insertase
VDSLLISNPLTRPLELLLVTLNNLADSLPLPESISSWAVAIFLVAVLVKVATQPLTSRQQASMRRMQELQPKLNALQKQHKDDREKLAQAQMDLYKQEGVSPFGGCLPLVIQMVVLFALWRAIMGLAGTEANPGPMAGERFLWIPDLSRCEPSPLCGSEFALLPLAIPIMLIVMVVSQIAYQHMMTPPSQSNDPQQRAMAQMSKFMPLIFAYIFIRFPAALVFYYATFNVVGVLQFGASRALTRDRLLPAAAAVSSGEIAVTEEPTSRPEEQSGGQQAGGPKRRRGRKGR